LAGILDMFRPFVEQGVNLLAPGGMFGMVLPDILLLKDYPDTRLFMLTKLTLKDIQWWGMAFRDAVIDAVTVLATKGSPVASNVVHVRLNDPENELDHEIPQNDFLANPRYTFNLAMTAEKRSVLESLDGSVRLGDFFEVHEGVHSGNMRAELFVDSPLDDSCNRLYFGRDEIAPYRLKWNGRYVRLGAVPRVRPARKYANVGRPAWHNQSKVLVRRTGDYVLAAVDEEGLYASNNFFLVFPKQNGPLDLHGLCGLLNSRFMTWFFRTIEPRKGRVFSELKIKHLSVFPLPKGMSRPDGCGELNALGKQRATEAGRLARARSPHERNVCKRVIRTLDEMIEKCVLSSIGLEFHLQKLIAHSLERE